MAKIGNQGDGGGAKPTVFNEKQVAQVETLAAVLSKGQLADYLGITEKTFRAVEQRQPEVATAYKKGKAKAIGTVAKGLLAQAREGNTTAAMFYLKTQAGWREQKQVEIVEDNNARNVLNVRFVDASDLRADKDLLDDEV
jgi:hypothetical protein